MVFSTNLDSYHGHPDPLQCPPERSRRSIATCYYTSLTDTLGAATVRTTNFQARPGSADRTDLKVCRHHFINDWVPAKLQKLARRFL